MVAPRKRYPKIIGPRNVHFHKVVKTLIWEINEERRKQKRKSGTPGPIVRETFATFAAKCGRYSSAYRGDGVGKYHSIFHNIHRGQERPSWDLIKRIALALPWGEYAIFERVQLLLDAMGKDLKRITVAYNTSNPVVYERLKAINRDLAIELIEQNKETKNEAV